MGDFLYNLGTIVQQQFNLSDNQVHSLSSQDDNGKPVQFGSLGDFSNKFDHTAERSYLEQGYTNHSMLPKALEIMMQEPNVTVLIKKKQFSSLSIHNKSEYMDEHEKTLLRTSSILFENKCKVIAAYEKLSKIEKISQINNSVEPNLLAMIVDSVDTIQSGTALFGNIFSKSFTDVIDTLRKVYAYNQINPVTTWIPDKKTLHSVGFGHGTGVIELNMVSTLHTTTSVKWGDGSCGFTIEDPYELMIVTNADIDKAISDSLNPYYQSKIFQLAQDSLQSTIDLKKTLLSDARDKRNVSKINFVVNLDTFLGSRIHILVDGIGTEIIYDSGTLQDQFSQITGIGSKPTDGFSPDVFSPTGSLGNQYLTNNEAQQIADIVTAINTKNAADTNSKNSKVKFNQAQNLLRTKMRLHYGNKPIIQPMDVVHVWVESKTRTDAKVSAGLTDFFTGFSFMEQFSKDLSTFKDQATTLFNPNDTINQVEKEIYTGNSNFPNSLWTLLRPYFVNDRAGTHIFAGLVNKANTGYSDHKFTITVDCSDNSGYFSMGKINFTPAIENFDGPLYDPVTPFDISFDTLTGKPTVTPPVLLDENIKYLALGTKYSSGPIKNTPSLLSNYYGQNTNQKNKNAAINNVYYDPSNFVYRWKDGIACLTQATTTGTNAILAGSFDKKNIVRTTKDAFAGQDVMNVVSILICGQPHNFSTFYKNAISFDSYKVGNVEPSYYTNLLNDIKKNNILYGKFSPFKNLVVDEASLAAALTQQTSTIENSTTLDNLLQTRAQLADQYSVMIGSAARAQSIAGLSASTINTAQANLEQQIADVNASINGIQGPLTQQLNMPNGGDKFYTIQGDDISFDSNNFTDSAADLSSVPASRDKLRRKLNQLTRRLMYKVKGNEDTNLFIVDDTYDKDLDLQAYSKELVGGSFSTFINTYQFPGELVASTAKLIDLEVFCDTQGHVRIRPPQYNRMPSSIFYKMINTKHQSGAQVYPQFIENLYKTQVQTALDAISISENEIRLQGVAIGKTSDAQLEDFIKSSNNAFIFLSDETTGTISIPNLFSIKDPDTLTQLNAVSSSLNSAHATGQTFTIIDRLNVLNSTQTLAAAPTNQTLSRYDQVSQNLLSLTGMKAPQIATIVPNSAANGPISEIDTFRVTKQIASLIASRAQQIKAAAGAIKNVQSAMNFEGTTSTQQQTAFPTLFSNKSIPDILKNMIEDESLDDYGPNSGSRYIIQNKHIINYNITETPPQFNMVEVNGLFGEGFVPSTPDLALTSDGGNALVSAFAVDYDLWRLYGFRSSQSFTVPFLSEPDIQCAPYAVSILNRIRGDILKGSVTTIGNEYYQPGEVYYLEPRDLLFYVDTVSHSFTYGHDFTSTLTLTYGHNAGEYTPTPFDVIGKVLFKNRYDVNDIVIKNDESSRDLPVGIVWSNQNNLSITIDQFIGGETNTNEIQNAVLATISAINPNNFNTSNPTQLEIRVYSNSTTGISTDPTVLAAAKLIMANITQVGVGANLITLPSGAVKGVQEVDLGLDTETRTPSRFAWSIARDLFKPAQSAPPGSKSLETLLSQHIIDLWIVNT